MIPPNPLEKPGYTLDFHDEFDGDTLDETKWIPYYLPQWSSRARSATSYRLENNTLALSLTEDHTPWCPEFDGDVRVSSLQTGVYAGPLGSPHGQHRFKDTLVVREEQREQRTYTPQYGYFETRVRAVRGAGSLCTLWMIGFEDTPEKSGEITVFELFGDQITPQSSEVRYGVVPWADPALNDALFRETLPMNATEFHIYAAEWTPTHIDFYVDNEKRRTVPQSPNYPMQFMLGTYALSGPSRHDFVIDYCRAYQPEGGY